MNGLDHPQRQECLSLKRSRPSWQPADHSQDHMMMIRRSLSLQQINAPNPNPNPNSRLAAGLREDLAWAVVPPAVTVVLEGRAICHRISLHKHASYQSLAKALHHIFASGDGTVEQTANAADDLDLSNAVPGHVIAYEDIENDLLLAGDLDWKDFVRVAKRIRILPAKSSSSRKARSEGV